jgi:hypothetical protein
MDGPWVYWGKMSQFKNITGASGGHAFQPGAAAAHYSEEGEEHDAEEELPTNTHDSPPPTTVPSSASHPPLSSTAAATTSTPTSLTADNEMDVDAISQPGISPVSSALFTTCRSLANISETSTVTTETSISSGGGAKRKFSALDSDDGARKPKSTRGRGPSHRDLVANQLTGSLNSIGDAWRGISVQRKAEEEAEDRRRKEEWARQDAQMAEKRRLELEGSPLAQRIFLNEEAFPMDLVLEAATFFSNPLNAGKANFYMAAPSTAIRRAYVLKELRGACVDVDRLLAQDSGVSA